MSACARRLTPGPGGPRPLSALFGENLILRNQGSGSRDVLERVLEERHHVGDFRHIVEISDLFVIKELVKADCGITFLYRKAVEKELAEGSLCQVALTDFQISHEFTFLWRKNSAFEAELRETSRALWTL
ncbi:LysR substrate-binding domain-containing protein [Flavonifractor plautii]|nr:LysR substrate-binding domain-containing protein [Flavonifractor plautii]